MCKKFISVFLSVLLIFTIMAPCALAADEVQHSETLSPTLYNSYKIEDTASIKETIDIESFYDLMFETAKNCPAEVDVLQYNIDKSDINNLLSYIWRECPELFNLANCNYWYNGENKITKLAFEYRFTGTEYQQMLAQSKAAAEAMIADIKDNNALTDLEKALIVHDRLAYTIAYNQNVADTGVSTDPMLHTIYGALVTKDAVCEGYSKAYAYILGKLGIECYYMSSDTMNHGWNEIVFDGQSYYVDVTWDDPTPNHPGKAKHDNFVVSYEIFGNTHRASDYKVISPVDTRYDDHFWKNANAAFQLIDNELYFFDASAQTLNRVDNLEAGTFTQLATIENTWYAGPTSYWNGDYTYLANDGEDILYSTPKSIYKYDISAGTSELIWTPDETAEVANNIFAFSFDGEYLYCVVNDTPNFEANTVSTKTVSFPYQPNACAHEWDAGQVITAATCCATGTKRFTCTICSDTMDEAIPVDPTNHDGDTEVRDAVAAGCSNDGYTGDTYCLGCDTKLETGTTISATGAHSWNAGEITTPATCVDTGVKTFTCTSCGDTRTEPVAIDANNHKTVVNDAAVESSCSQTGLTAGSHCTACNTTIVAQTTTPKKAHTEVTVQENVINASCTVAGSYDSVVKCSVCHTEISRTHITGETAPHSYTVHTSTVPSTCNVLGHKVMKCENCTATTNVALTEYGAHTWNAGVITTPATCVDTGVKTFTCSVCDSTKTEPVAVDANNHKNIVDDAAVESTCTQAGLTAGKHCAACNKVTVAQTATAMKAHVYTVLVDTIPSTCNALGHKVMKCENCTATTNVALTEYGVHTWNAGEITTPATCVDTGVKTFTCTTCNDTKTEPVAIDANNHKSIITVHGTAATCTAEGLSDGRVCEACNTVLVAQTAVAKKAHSYTVLVNTVPSTCDTLGHKVMKCATCEATTNVNLTTYAPHTLSVEIVTEPTCTEKGTRHIFCTVCEYEKTEDIDAGHTDTDNDHICDICGESVIDTENCSCICHKSGFLGFIWKILRIFYKLFGRNPVCECGAAHY